MAFKTYQATEEDKQQQIEQKTYKFLTGLNLVKSIPVKKLETKQETKQGSTLTCIYFKCFKSFGDLNSLLKENNLKKKQLKEKCRICAACHAFI